MIKRIPVPEVLIRSVEGYLNQHNLGNRGVEDGNKHKQLVGLIGELTVNKYLFA